MVQPHVVLPACKVRDEGGGRKATAQVASYPPRRPVIGSSSEQSWDERREKESRSRSRPPPPRASVVARPPASDAAGVKLLDPDAASPLELGRCKARASPVMLLSLSLSLPVRCEDDGE
jgi:hypothetical protein